MSRLLSHVSLMVMIPFGWAITLVAAHAVVPAMPNQIPLRPGEKAVIEARANRGDHVAQQTMADINTDWANEKPDYVAALSWYEKATSDPQLLKDPKYLYAHLGTRFWSHERADELRAFNAEHAALYAKAQTGEPQALLAFAWHTPHMASGISGDAPFAHWLLQAARAGSGKAQGEIGYLYLRAHFIRIWGHHNDNEAAREKGYKWGFGEFWRELSSDEPLGFDGESRESDIANAIYWLKKAAAKGDALSEFNLGLAYAVSGSSQNLYASSLWLHRGLFLDPTLRSRPAILT